MEGIKKALLDLAKEKSESEGPKTSWHNTIHLDIERNIEWNQGRLFTFNKVLSTLEKSEYTGLIIDGSIIFLEIGEDKGIYIVVEKGAGTIGEYVILSLQSPIGQLISGQPVGYQAVSPAGDTIKVLQVI